jgi:hypothetical protein
MKPFMYASLAAALLAAPLAAFAYQPGLRATDAEAPLRHTVQVNQTADVPLRSGCTYHASVQGTVTPVPENRNLPAVEQRVRPDLQVTATVRCPGSTEAHIQERAVRSTGMTRAEFEHLLRLNASVERMQNSGRCMYLPEFALRSDNVHLRGVRYLCPTRQTEVRGGGPR